MMRTVRFSDAGIQIAGELTVALNWNDTAPHDPCKLLATKADCERHVHVPSCWVLRSEHNLRPVLDWTGGHITECWRHAFGGPYWHWPTHGGIGSGPGKPPEQKTAKAWLKYPTTMCAWVEADEDDAVIPVSRTAHTSTHITPRALRAPLACCVSPLTCHMCHEAARRCATACRRRRFTPFGKTSSRSHSRGL